MYPGGEGKNRTGLQDPDGLHGSKQCPDGDEKTQNGRRAF